MARDGTPAGYQAFLDAAREEFSEKGYAAASIRQISKRAGLSLSVLYHYHSGKQELLNALVDESMDAFFEAYRSELAGAGEGPAERLAVLVAATIRFRSSHPSMGNLIQREERSLEPAHREHYRKRVAEASRLFDDTIAEGIAAGVFDTPYPKDARRAVMAMCTSISDWYDPAGELTVDDLIVRYTALAFTVLGHRP